MADILSSAGIDPQTMQSLGIAPQQPQGMLGNIGAFLAHPAVQGALATYLGAISSPRRLGWGGAIGRGGLAGLNAFGQAEKLEEQLPLERAKAIGEIVKIPEERAHTEYLNAQTGLAKGKAAAFAPDQNDANTWATLAQQEADPTSRAIYSTLANGRAKGSITQDNAVKTYNLLRQGDTKAALAQAQMDLTKQRTALATEQTNLLPGRIASEENASNASAARSRAGVGEEAATTNLRNLQAQNLRTTGSITAPAPTIEYGPGGATKRTRSLTPDTGYTFQHPSTAGKTDPRVALRKEAEAQAEDFVKSGWYGSIASREAAKQQYINAYMAKHGAAAGQTVPGASVKNSIAGSL